MLFAGPARTLAIAKAAGRSTIVQIVGVHIPQTLRQGQAQGAVDIQQRRVVGRGLKEYTVTAVCCWLMTETVCYWESLVLLLILFHLF